MKKIYYIILIIVLPSCDPIDNFDYSHIQYDYKVLKYDGKDFLSDWGINVPNYPLTYAYMNYEADMIISGEWDKSYLMTHDESCDVIDWVKMASKEFKDSINIFESVDFFNYFFLKKKVRFNYYKKNKYKILEFIERIEFGKNDGLIFQYESDWTKFENRYPKTMSDCDSCEISLARQKCYVPENIEVFRNIKENDKAEDNDEYAISIRSISLKKSCVCSSLDIFIKYSFYDDKGYLQVRKSILNPYSLIFPNDIHYSRSQKEKIDKILK